MEGEKKRLLRHPALRRLPIIAVAAIGVWLWQGGAREREIFWQLPADRAGIERVKLVLKTADGQLVRSDEQFFEDGRPVPSEIVTQIRVPDGRYRAEVTVRRRGVGAQVQTRDVRVEGETASVQVE